MVDVRRYYTEQGSPLSQEDILATQAITAEPTEEEPIGPTTEMPFRYTEQALNPRGEAVTGMAQRDPRARSAFTGVPAQVRQAGGMFHDERIPIRRAELAMGNISDYRGLEGFNEIDYAPGSMRGREAIAVLPGFEGDKYVTGLVDMKQMAQGMGISEERANQLLRFNPETGYQVAHRHGGRGTGEVMSEAQMMEMIAKGVRNPNAPQLERGDRDTGEYNLTRDDFVRSMRPLNYSSLGRLSDEERLFRGFAKLSGSSGKGWSIDDATGGQKNLDLNMDDPRHLDYLMRRVGGNSFMRDQFASSQGMDSGTMFQHQRNIDRGFRKAGRKSGSIWENPGKIGLGVILAGMAAMTGGALAPLAAGALGIGAAGGGLLGAGTIGASMATGAIGGMIGGGAMTGLQAMTGQDVSWKSGLMNVGLGALGGGLMGGLTHGIHNLGAGAGFTQNLAGGPSSMYIPAGGGYVDVPASMMQSAGGGIVGAGTAAGGKVIQTPMGPMAMQPSGAGSVSAVPVSSGNIQQLGIAGGAGGVGGGLSPEENPFTGGGGKLAKSAAISAARGGVGAVAQGMEQQAAMQQGLQDAANRGRQSAAQARSTRQGIQSQYPGIFGQQLPDNPFYNPNAYTDLGGVQEDIF